MYKSINVQSLTALITECFWMCTKSSSLYVHVCVTTNELLTPNLVERNEDTRNFEDSKRFG